jgi:hypothetical protein
MKTWIFPIFIWIANAYQVINMTIEAEMVDANHIMFTINVSIFNPRAVMRTGLD